MTRSRLSTRFYLAIMWAGFNLTAVVEKRSNNAKVHSKKQVKHDRRMNRVPVTLSSSFEKTNFPRVHFPKDSSVLNCKLGHSWTLTRNFNVQTFPDILTSTDFLSNYLVKELYEVSNF